MEKADIARRRRDQSGDDVAPPQDDEPSQIAVAEQTGKQNGGDDQIARGRHILHGLLLVEHRDKGEKGAGEPDRLRSNRTRAATLAAIRTIITASCGEGSMKAIGLVSTATNRTMFSRRWESALPASSERPG